MKAGRIALLLAFALLLTACGAPEAEPSPTPGSSGGKVAVHWDALTPKPENVAKRWYEGYTDELIPSDDYGELVPYIGGEMSHHYVGTSWYYGLTTRDGVIITDPVYADVSATDGGSALVLRTAVPNDAPIVDEWTPRHDDRYGLAAIDGSWYTGQIYTDKICTSTLGALFFDTDGDVVMVSAEDGSELFRWRADELPIEGLEPSSFYWEIVSVEGEYMRFMHWGTGGENRYDYVDLRTGELLDTAPDVFNVVYDGETMRYDGGTYTVSDGAVTINADSGETHTFPVPDWAGEFFYPDINGDRILIGHDGVTLLTDLDGNELARIDGIANWTWQLYGTAWSLPAVTDYVSSEDGLGFWVDYTLYDRDGELMGKFSGNVEQWGDRLLIADSDSYRLTDLEGSDLIRLSRFDQLDIPAEE